MGRRIIVCDGAEIARLWSRIGAGQGEELTWVPREEESRARPPGFRALQGGLSEEGFLKLEPRANDEFALASDEGPWLRTGIRTLAKVAPHAPILVLSDTLSDEDLPAHACL